MPEHRPPRSPPAPGNSVTVLLTVYAHCIDGQDHITNRLIEHALRPASPALCPKASGSAKRRYRPHPVRYMSVNRPACPGMDSNRLGPPAASGLSVRWRRGTRDIFAMTP